jgi:spoIIIJ-associated protein
MSEAHEFIGRDRAEALAKAAAFFGVGEDDLAIAEVDPTKATGVGTRVVLVAYRRAAGPPSRRSSEGRGPEGGRERPERGYGRRDREPREGREGRRERGRGRPFEEAEPRVRRPIERPERSPEEAVPSQGTATTPLSDIGQFVCGLIERMGVGSFEIAESGESEGLIVVQLRGPASSRLSSGDGRAVDAVQLLANQASLCAAGDEAKRVVIEVEGNADQRAAFLAKIADRAAQRARETGRPVALEAMSPRERRTVHLALREVDGIATMSVGDGRYRQVVVVPDSAPEYEEAKRYETQALRENRD